MITSDSHMHTRFSTDSDADIRDMIESALKKRIAVHLYYRSY